MARECQIYRSTVHDECILYGVALLGIFKQDTAICAKMTHFLKSGYEHLYTNLFQSKFVQLGFMMVKLCPLTNTNIQEVNCSTSHLE